MGCDEVCFANITGKYSGQAQTLTVQPVTDVQAWSVNHNGTLPCHFTLNKTYLKQNPSTFMIYSHIYHFFKVAHILVCCLCMCSEYFVSYYFLNNVSTVNSFTYNPPSGEVVFQQRHSLNSSKNWPNYVAVLIKDGNLIYKLKNKGAFPLR